MSGQRSEKLYRLIFCDLDGTTSTYEHNITTAVQQAMRDVIASDAWITINTGRGYQTLIPFLDRIPVNAPLICCNGGLIVDPATCEILKVEPTPLSLAHQLIGLVQEKGLEMWVYLDDMETMFEYNPAKSQAVIRRDGEIVHQVTDPIEELERPPHKLLIITESPQDTPAAVKSVKACVLDEARVVTSSPRLIEVIMPGVSKAHAASWMADHLGVAREETIAVGDGNNDIEMLSWAGLGIAMGNATPEVQAVADWTAPHVDKDGLAVALKRFVLDV
ncbi:MAG: HAD family phosphatase [Chloroflexi bacterium]|nr:HAD family phosphatase [Chloroflexota bacterium]